LQEFAAATECLGQLTTYRFPDPRCESGMVRSLKQAGYEPDADKLIAMRIHGATPEWVADLKKRVTIHVDPDKLIGLPDPWRVAGFYRQLQKLGYSHRSRIN